MIDEENRGTAQSDASSGLDPIVTAMRDIPKMRSVENLDGTKMKPFVPPPPMSSRVGGLSQGCGGVLLTLLGLMMMVVALWFGYYLWGPGLLFAGGLLLIGGTAGVWSGRRVPVIASIVTLVISAIVGYFWSSFVPAAGALSPLGSVGVFLGPLSMLLVLVLVIALLAHLFSLYYWKRLRPVSTRSIIVWAVMGVALVIVVVVVSFVQQSQRKSWLDDHYQTWTAEAAGESLITGSTVNVTLGYSFVTTEEGDDTRLDIRLAELESVVEAGAQVIRISASGDMLLEAQEPRIFKLDDTKDPNEEMATAQARVTRQQADEDTYMARVLASGDKLVLSDAQYSPYLLVVSDDTKEKTTWEDFTAIQEDRVRHYAALYQPYAYEIITEPAMYVQYSAIDDGTDDIKLDLWTAQAERLIAAVQEESPDTLIGVTIALHSDFDQDFYERVLSLDGLDFIGVRIFQPGAFAVLDDLQVARGSAIEHGKQLWITETWYGYCLAPQRSMDLDAAWLETAAAFAQKEQISTLLTNDYGCFLQAGGTLFQVNADLSGRTKVWDRWRALIATVSPAS